MKEFDIQHETNDLIEANLKDEDFRCHMLFLMPFVMEGKIDVYDAIEIARYQKKT